MTPVEQKLTLPRGHHKLLGQAQRSAWRHAQTQLVGQGSWH